jgi:GTP-binding protein
MSEHLPLTYTNAAFEKSAAKLSQCPTDIIREVAFAGRSNAGKSSALNTLTGQKKLARTSKTPGRTQLINFFRLGETKLALVDLPGYGYAKVPVDKKNEWQKELETYLNRRQAAEANMPVHILLTKSDKLKRGPAKTTMLKVKKAVADLGDLVTVQTFSSHNNEGLGELKNKLTGWLDAPFLAEE